MSRIPDILLRVPDTQKGSQQALQPYCKLGFLPASQLTCQTDVPAMQGLIRSLRLVFPPPPSVYGGLLAFQTYTSFTAQSDTRLLEGSPTELNEIHFQARVHSIAAFKCC